MTPSRRTLAALIAGAVAAFGAPQAPRAQAAETVPAGGDWLAALVERPVAGLGRPTGPWTLDLPADHAPHPDARSEVWQIAVHLADADGTPVGLQLSLLRLGLVGPEAPPATSDWLARELWRGHVIVLDDPDGPARGEERFGRGMPGVAGFDTAALELRLDGWAVRFAPAPGPWHLSADTGGLRAELTLAPLRPALATGDAPDGAPDAAGAPLRGYAVTRLAAEGWIETAGARRAVAGTAWAEHLWGELPLAAGGPVASDRLQLQLDDGSDLTVLRARRRDGGGRPTVDALLIDADGTVTALDGATAEIEPTRHWQGAQARWPVAWTLRLGAVALRIAPVADAQEHAFLAPVWSGLVHAEGQRNGQPVTGRGTLLLTGYED